MQPYSETPLLHAHLYQIKTNVAQISVHSYYFTSIICHVILREKCPYKELKISGCSFHILHDFSLVVILHILPS